MRRNLDQSEAAIIQVFEEKQRVWERQMDELRQNYASRLQQVTACTYRSTCTVPTLTHTSAFGTTMSNKENKMQSCAL